MKISILLLVAIIGIEACGASGVVAPRSQRPADNYVCRNSPPFPSGDFRMIRTLGAGVDTTDAFANRYLEPHRSADTIRVTGKDGVPIFLIWSSGGDSSTYCVTLYDSLSDHMPNLRGVIFAP
ncbi:MAG TPA: hypothetical protein VN903_14260 [Polyangia bacterium]|nr:hypothetical protein [Polyangia bacterium]